MNRHSLNVQFWNSMSLISVLAKLRFENCLSRMRHIFGTCGDTYSSGRYKPFAIKAPPLGPVPAGHASVKGWSVKCHFVPGPQRILEAVRWGRQQGPLWPAKRSPLPPRCQSTDKWEFPCSRDNKLVGMRPIRSRQTRHRHTGVCPDGAGRRLLRRRTIRVVSTYL